MKKAVFISFGALLLIACSGSKGNRQVVDGAKDSLLFQSGFEGTCCVTPNEQISELLTPGFPTDHIVGIDTTLSEKNDWEVDLPRNMNDGLFLLEYTGGDSTQRCVRIVTDPVKSGNHVLMYALKDAWKASENQVKSRIQADIYGIKPGLKEFYQSVRLFVDKDFELLENYPDEIRWLTISEFWNNEWWIEGEQYGFRIGLGIGKLTAEKSELKFLLNAEDTGQVEVWRAHTDVKVPIGQWFTLEYYFKEGDKESGRFWLAVTPDGKKKTVVFDVHNYTHNTSNPAPDGLTGYNPMKLYTSQELVSFMKDRGKELRIYWDDFKLWKNKRPE